jgi:hypothetical protein
VTVTFVDAGLSTRIHNKHSAELARFCRELSATWHWQAASPGKGYYHRRSPRLGPVQSFEDTNTNLTIAAHTAELAWFTAHLVAPGICITVVIAGHRRETGIRAPLPLAECDTWVHAVLGPAWITHTYRADGTRSASGHLHLLTYRMFLDGQHNPISMPDEISDDGFRPLNDHSA